MFGAMRREYGERYDPNRPSIELYRTEKEVVLLLPIGQGGNAILRDGEGPLT